jgi:hypothetical protein
MMQAFIRHRAGLARDRPVHSPRQQPQHTKYLTWPYLRRVSLSIILPKRTTIQSKPVNQMSMMSLMLTPNTMPDTSDLRQRNESVSEWFLIEGH